MNDIHAVLILFAILFGFCLAEIFFIKRILNRLEISVAKAIAAVEESKNN